uniref:ATPase AAA-type core domain-containing protein n=1 Tax=Brassica oleracea var. oleracea TaxID=109376 RepID=A0A0D3BYP1_BRAOL
MSLWKDHPVMTSSRSSLSGDKSNHTTRFKMSAPLPNSQQIMKTEFMALWDRFSTDPNARVMVLAATNRPSELDEAIMRRLPQAFEIGMPERKERAEILKVTLKGERVEPDIDYDHLARLCEGYTGSYIFELCKKAAYFPIREILEEERKWRPYPLSFI